MNVYHSNSKKSKVCDSILFSIIMITVINIYIELDNSLYSVIGLSGHEVKINCAICSQTC